MSFLRELKRRKVVRVAIVYAATAFVVLQAGDLLASGLGRVRADTLATRTHDELTTAARVITLVITCDPRGRVW